MTEILRHRDFTKSKKQEPVSFTLDGDLFHCVRKMPAEFTKKISNLKTIEETTAKLDFLTDLLSGLLKNDSLDLFNKRLDDRDNPIDLEEIGEIVEWLIEVYTGRPLERSEESVNGSTIDSIVSVGTSSTDGAPVETLIRTNSPQTVF